MQHRPHRRPPRRGSAAGARLAPLLAAAVGLAAALGTGGCALIDPPTPTPPRQLAMNRDTPRATYDYFKTMVRNNQWAAEWSTFSPNFKRLLNQSVGRNVDAGDYNLARQTLADNSTPDMQLLLDSTFVNEQRVGPNAAIVTIEAGGRQLSPRLVRLARWELQVAGDDTPYGDFVTSAGDAVRIESDGSITVRIQPPQGTASLVRTFRPEQIEAFRVESQWYVDDFGGLDRQIVQQAEGEQPADGPASAPQPAPEPSAPPAWGSPDGGAPAGEPSFTTPPPSPGDGPRPPRPPPAGNENQGWGSPDG